jgi:long-subunit acyl-CoA synthetase (AMP-forming)
VFVDPTLVNNLLSALKLKDAPRIPTDRIILMCQVGNRPATLSQYKCIEEVWSEPTEMVPLKKGEEHETTVLLYSSGTTGRAKGVETTHYNLTSQLQALILAIENLDPAKDVTLGYLPMGHAYLFSTGMVSENTQAWLSIVPLHVYRSADGGSTPVLGSRYAKGDPEI